MKTIIQLKDLLNSHYFYIIGGILLFVFFLYLSKKLHKPGYIFSIIDDSSKPIKNSDKEKKKRGLSRWIQAIQNKLGNSKRKEKEWLEVVEENKNELHKSVYYDKLTQLPNRAKLTKEFNKKIQETPDTEMAVYIMDIDRFRTINELYGREVGDQVLIKIAERLSTLLGERAIIARESEDELYILIDNMNDKDTKELGKEIVSLFTQPFKFSHTSFYVTASIGSSRYPETAQDIEALLQQAEIAMYKVKTSGKNNYHLFMVDDAAAIERKRRIEFGLKEALANNELYLAYQPKIKMTTEDIYGVEALLRWTHPLLGSVSPGEFIPIAEESGMINEIGYWVINEAVRQTKKWQKLGRYLHISVNVSALQFEDPYFVTRLINVLELYDLEANYFIVEITESVMQDVEHSNRVIKQLHKYGVNVAIDDFGTGYSSLSVLNNVFIDIVKIDKSFIDHVATKANTASLVKTMIKMGKSLNFSIVAEGIESKEQSIFLKDNNCEYGQGYYFSKPVRPDEITKLTLKNIQPNHEA